MDKLHAKKPVGEKAAMKRDTHVKWGNKFPPYTCIFRK